MFIQGGEESFRKEINTTCDTLMRTIKIYESPKRDRYITRYTYMINRKGEIVRCLMDKTKEVQSPRGSSRGRTRGLPPIKIQRSARRTHPRIEVSLYSTFFFFFCLPPKKAFYPLFHLYVHIMESEDWFFKRKIIKKNCLRSGLTICPLPLLTSKTEVVNCVLKKYQLRYFKLLI